MLAQRASKIARDISQDYDRSKILELLKHAINVAQLRGGPNYAQNAQNVVSSFQEVQKSSIFNTYSPDDYSSLLTLDCNYLLPLSIANRMISGFSGQDMNHIGSSELGTLLAVATNFRNEITGYLAFSSNLKIKTESIAEGSIALDLVFPKQVYSGIFSTLLEHYENFDKIFQSIAELIGEERRSPNFFRTSTSTLMASLLFLQEHGLSVLAWYSGIVTAADKTLDFYKNIVNIRSAKLPADVLQNLENSQEVAAKGFIDEEINKFVADYASKLDEHRSNELRNELAIYSRNAVRDVMLGARISISIENISGKNLDNIPNKAEVLGALASTRQLHDRIEQSRNSNQEISGLIASRPTATSEAPQSKSNEGANRLGNDGAQ